MDGCCTYNFIIQHKTNGSGPKILIQEREIIEIADERIFEVSVKMEFSCSVLYQKCRHLKVQVLSGVRTLASVYKSFTGSQATRYNWIELFLFFFL